MQRGARVLGVGMRPTGANEIAGRARGTPRIAGRLLRRVRDFAAVDGARAIDARGRRQGAARSKSTRSGLDQLDRRYLELIADNFGGGPVGIETIAAALSEPRDAIEDIIEPFLIQQGFVQRTPRGRMLTPQAFRHLGLAAPARDRAAQSACSADEREDVSLTPCGGPRRPAVGRRTSCRCASITRTRTFPASSTTPATCASWSAGAPISCASPALTNALHAGGQRLALPCGG